MSGKTKEDDPSTSLLLEKLLSGGFPNLQEQVREALLTFTEKNAVFKTMLEEHGYTANTASSGQEALSLADSSFDLVILDIKLPDIMGDQVAIMMKERRMADNTVLMTGYPELEDCIDTLGVGIQEILIKPISPDEILRVAREALSKI